MAHITYQELVERYGQKLAYALLRVVENSSHLETGAVTLFDFSERLQCALCLMHDNPTAA